MNIKLKLMLVMLCCLFLSPSSIYASLVIYDIVPDNINDYGVSVDIQKLKWGGYSQVEFLCPEIAVTSIEFNRASVLYKQSNESVKSDKKLLQRLV